MSSDTQYVRINFGPDFCGTLTCSRCYRVEIASPKKSEAELTAEGLADFASLMGAPAEFTENRTKYVKSGKPGKPEPERVFVERPEQVKFNKA